MMHGQTKIKFTFVCFQEVKIFAGKQTLFKYVVIIKFVAVHYTAFKMAQF